MTQSSTLGDVPTGTGQFVRTSFNQSIEALATDNEGITTPSITYPFMVWRNNTAKLIQQRNSTNTGWEIIQNYGATTSPTANEDSGDGYIRGSIWINVTLSKVFICSNATVAAATWIDVSSGSIATNSVTNTLLADMATATIKGRTTAGTGDPEDLTAAQTRTLLAVADAVHATQHKSGGSDAIKLDELAAPTDITTRNATTGQHGLLPKLSGNVADVLRGDGTFGSGGGAVADDSITNAKLANVATATIKGRTTAGTGDPEDLTAAQTRTLLVVADAVHATQHKSAGSDSIKLDELAAPTDITTLNATSSAHGLLPKLDNDTSHFLRGDGTWTVAATTVTTVPDDAVTNAKLANVATATIKGRTTAGTGDPEDLTVAQARTLLNVENGANSAGVSGDAYAISHAAAAGSAHAAASTSVAGFLSASDKTKLDGSSPFLTASTIMMRDASNRCRVSTPAVGDDIANKTYVDAAVTAGSVPDGTITNAKLANMAAGTIKGRVLAGTGVPGDLTAADIRTLINVEDGATAEGTSGDSFASTHLGSGGTQHAAASITTAGFMSAADKAGLDASTWLATPLALMLRDSSGRARVNSPSDASDIANKSYVDSSVAGSQTSLGGGVITPNVMGVLIQNTVSETTIANFPIPANSLATTNDSATFNVLSQVLNSSGDSTVTITVRVLLGATEIATDITAVIPSVATLTRAMNTSVIIYRDSDTTVRGLLLNDISNAGSVSAPTVGQGDLTANKLFSGPFQTAHTSPAASWSADQNLTIKMTLSLANANFTVRSYNGNGFAARRAGGIFKLDDLGAPDDNTDLNATTATHGLLPKLNGDSATYLDGSGSFSTPAGTGGGGGGGFTGTTLAVYTDDPTLSTTDDVLEVYSGRRIKLPPFDGGRPDRITVINAGNATSTIIAHNQASVVKGAQYADIGTGNQRRLQLSAAAPTISSVLTVAFWIRGNSTNTSQRSIFSIGDGVDDATSFFRIYLEYQAPNTFIRAESRKASTTTLTRRFPITQSVLHHVALSINLAGPAITASIDGISVTRDTTFAGDVLTSAQGIGGSGQTVRIGSGIASHSQEWQGSIAQVLACLTYTDLTTESNRRALYNDGAVSYGDNGLTINGIDPFVHLNTFPAGTPGTAANTGTTGGNFVDQATGSPLTSLAVGGADSALLEQIDGYPSGYLLPVSSEVRLIRRSSKGVWGVF